MDSGKGSEEESIFFNDQLSSDLHFLKIHFQLNNQTQQAQGFLQSNIRKQYYSAGRFASVLGYSLLATWFSPEKCQTNHNNVQT